LRSPAETNKRTEIPLTLFSSRAQCLVNRPLPRLTYSHPKDYVSAPWFLVTALGTFDAKHLWSERIAMSDNVYEFAEAEAKARLAALPPSQRAVVKAILAEKPRYRYNLAPPLYPPPRPGLPSALAAVQALVARIKSKTRQ